MSQTLFELFLLRNKPEIQNRFGQHLASVFATLPQAELDAITSQLVEFFIERLLGNLKVSDNLSQQVIAGTLEKKVSPEIMQNNINQFIVICKIIAQTDPQLNTDQRQHIQKVLDQSHKFLLNNVYLVKSQNLKKD